MPAHLTAVASNTTEKLIRLGRQIRAYRKSLKINATIAAEAAGMSRVTFYRIEKGELSVTMGAYLNAIAALGLELDLINPTDHFTKVTKDPEDNREGWIPSKIRLADYPQLKQLAWQVHGIDELTPGEALSIYERNWRHVNIRTMETRERNLVKALRIAFGGCHVDL